MKRANRTVLVAARRAGVRLLPLFFLLSGAAPAAATPASAPVAATASESVSPARSGSGAPDPGPDFATLLAAHMALSATERAELRAHASEGLEIVDRFRYEAHAFADAGRRQWFYRDVEIDFSTGGVGLGVSIKALGRATDVDPSFAEAWAELGHLAADAGDLLTARRALDNARAAGDARAATADTVAAADRRELLRDRAWVLRDLALWDEGLAAVTEGLAVFPGDRDLILIKGLLLAGAGRYSEATSLAVRMPPFTYPQLDVYHYGTREQTSDFANRWIRSQALLAVGDLKTARHVLGDMGSYPYRWFLPHQKRFWADVGLVAELSGDTDAPVYYALGIVGDEFRGFYRFTASNRRPLVLDAPDPLMPCFTSFGDRFHAGGSVLTYAAGQMTRSTMAMFPAEQEAAAERARLALDIAERRNIRPDVVRALRGRIHFGAERYGAARADLVAARDAFAGRDLVDPGTSLLLGLLDMNEGAYAAAASFFREAVDADPHLAVGWRSLGVCLARLERTAEATEAMDRALALEPFSVAGLYNRGLLRLQQRDFLNAGADLELALKFDPENREVQRLLQMAASGLRAEGGDPGRIHALAESAAAGDDSTLTVPAMMAMVEADLAAFFAVPDSARGALGPDDAQITDLRQGYAASGDPGARAALALACLDRGLWAEAQALLAPGWGVDLSPQEEVMLLRADRTLGEHERADALSERLNSGEDVPTNAYVLFELIEYSRENWQERLATAHYMEGYSAALMMTIPDHARFSNYMRYGFGNLRQEVRDGEGVPVNTMVWPMYRYLNRNDGAGNGTAAVSSKQVGNVRK